MDSDTKELFRTLFVVAAIPTLAMLFAAPQLSRLAHLGGIW